MYSTSASELQQDIDDLENTLKGLKQVTPFATPRREELEYQIRIKKMQLKTMMDEKRTLCE